MSPRPAFARPAYPIQVPQCYDPAMRGRDLRPRSGFDQELTIDVAPTRAMGAFFDPHALVALVAGHSVGDDASRAGRLRDRMGAVRRRGRGARPAGGRLSRTIVEYIAGTQLFVADAWWLPPDGDPLGPMGLQVSCAAEGSGCRLHVHQAGYEDTLAVAAVLRGDRARAGARRSPP